MKTHKILKAVVALAIAVIPTVMLSQSVSASSSKITLKQGFNNFLVYQKNGKSVLQKQDVNGRSMTEAVTVKPGSTMKYYGQPIIIKTKQDIEYSYDALKLNPKLMKKHSIEYVYQPAPYVNIGNNHYLKGQNIASMNGKNVLILGSNAYIYNKRGQRISYKGQRVIPKYSLITSSSKSHKATKSDKFIFYTNLSQTKSSALKMYTIRGSKYYYLGSGAYINAGNVTLIDGHSVYQNGGSTIIRTSINLPVYNYKLKQTSRIIKAGQKLKVDGLKETGNGDNSTLYFKVAGTNGKNAQYLYWGDSGQYGIDDQDVTDEYMGNFTFDTRLR